MSEEVIGYVTASLAKTWPGANIRVHRVDAAPAVSWDITDHEAKKLWHIGCVVPATIAEADTMLADMNAVIRSGVPPHLLEAAGGAVTLR